MLNSSSAGTEWFHEATRWTQVTFAEDDPLHFDLDRWRDVMVRTRSNALCVSAGGYVAYYPSKLPSHHVSSFLGDGDLLGSMVELARSLGMKVMARIDPHAVHTREADAHPEWLARRSDGSALAHPAHEGAWLTCAHSSYYSDFLTDVARELVRDYGVDAIFANRWSGPAGVSYSDAARASFERETGRALPVDESRTDPVWLEYGQWYGRRLSSLVEIWDAAVRDVDPSARFVPNRGEFQLKSLDADVLDRATPFFVIDKQGRSDREALWATGRVGKRSRGTYPDRPVALISSVGPEHARFRWKDSVDSPAELEVSIADAVLHDANPWITKFNGRIIDDRWIDPVARAFALHATLEPHYRASTAQYEVVILANLSVDESDLAKLYTATFDEEDGIYQALLEARVPFGFVSEARVTASALAGVKVIILPDIRHIPATTAAVLRAFVEGGGSLIATDRSLLDHDGDIATASPLADLFGVVPTGRRRGPVKNNYIAITAQHAASSGFEGTTRIIGGTAIVPIEAAADAVVPFAFVPDFPDLPMEEVYPREQARDAAVVCRDHEGGGRTAYVAFDLGGVYWEALQQDHARLIGNLVGWALGEAPRVSVSGRGLIDIAVRHKQGGVLVGLVNLDNPLAMRGQLHWIRPLEAQTVRIALPAASARAEAALLVSGRSAVARVEGDELLVEILPTEIMEVVEVTWTGGL